MCSRENPRLVQGEKQSIYPKHGCVRYFPENEKMCPKVRKYTSQKDVDKCAPFFLSVFPNLPPPPSIPFLGSCQEGKSRAVDLLLIDSQGLYSSSKAFPPSESIHFSSGSILKGIHFKLGLQNSASQ